MKELTPRQMRSLLAKVAKLEAANAKLRATKSNVNGGTREVDRGAWCTSADTARMVGPWDHDPFSNPRSNIVSRTACMLERGDDGLAGPRVGEFFIAGLGRRLADEDTRLWGQPPYTLVPEALSHYGHTRFCFLLRFDPSTKWFSRLYQLSKLVCVLRKREPFVPPPGVKASSNPHAHALFYRDERDATPEVLRRSVAWRTR